MRYEIVVRGELGDSFASTFGETRLERHEGKTLLVVDVIDQAQLQAVLNRLGDHALEIESMNPSQKPDPGASSAS